MNNTLKHAEEKADLLVEAALKNPESLLASKPQPAKWKSLYQKLLELYIQESKTQPSCKKLLPSSHLLDKLVQRENLNTLVVNMYPGNEGYSLMLRGKNGADSETIRLPYEESELLEYIDEEQLPPLLVDLLDRAQANVFYCGCVIVEVRDYRRTTNGTYETHHVLLRPTAQTLLCDINSIVVGDGRYSWTQDDVHYLESQLVLHTSAPLCLDPSPSVFLVTNKLNHAKHRFNTHALRRSVKKYSQAAVNRKRKMAQCVAPKDLYLYDFIQRKKDKLKPSPPVNLKVGKTDPPVIPLTCVDMWRQREVHLTTPEVIDVEKYATALEKPKPSRDNTPIVVEEYTFETERSHGKVNFSQLTIVQRLSDEFYMGELYVDRDYVEGQSKGSTCKFPLGTKVNVEKYIRQFREIFTEEGRRQVKITHKVPGQNPVVTYTQTIPVQATPTPVAIGNNQTFITQATNLAAAITGQIQQQSQQATGVITPNLSDLGSGRKGASIRLSLSLNPQTPGSAMLSPQGTPAQSPVGGPQLNTQQQLQRIRQIGIYGTMQRPSNERPSPVTTPTSTGHLPSYTQALTCTPTSAPTSMGAPPTPGGRNPTPVATPTSPPIMPLTPGSRRSSVQEYGQQGMISGSGPSTPSTPTSQLDGGFLSPTGTHTAQLSLQGAQAGGPPNVNIANITSLPPNINIQNLQNIHGIQNLASIQGLPSSIQVSQGAGTTLTMVTAISSNTSTPTATTGVAGHFTPPTTMLSLPIGMQGNLTQIMAAAGIKGAQGIRPGTPLLLSQIPGQQSVQLLSTGSLPPGTRPAQLGGATMVATATHTMVKHSMASPPPHGQGSVLATSPQLGTIQQLRGASGQPQQATISPHQLMQLSSQPQLTHIALQRPQQARPLQLSQSQAAAQAAAAKSKSKKRATPTPPKS